MQWVEILVSFKIVAGLVTPVQLPKMNRVWQSPSVDHWLPLPPSLGVESNAFNGNCQITGDKCGEMIGSTNKSS